MIVVRLGKKVENNGEKCPRLLRRLRAMAPLQFVVEGTDGNIERPRLQRLEKKVANDGVGEQERGHRVKILLGKWKGQNPTQSVYRSGRKKVERGSRSCVFVGGCPFLSCNKKELFIHGAKFPSHTLALP